MEEECGRTLRNFNKGWIKRTIVFLKSAYELKLRRSREECSRGSKDREPMLAKRPNPEERIGEVSCNKEDMLLQRL